MAKLIVDEEVRQIFNKIDELCDIEKDESNDDEDEHCNAVFIQVLSEIDDIFNVKEDLSFENKQCGYGNR